MREQKAEEWIEEGVKLFGEDRKKWQFKCVNCGHVQCIEDFIKLGMTEQEASRVVYFSCIGRWIKNSKGELGNKKSPCNYTLGGLFNLAELVVIDPDGTKHTTFEFAVPLHAKARSIPA